MRLTNRQILLFWAPLAATWLMMAAEGPFLAAVIARLADPKFNLAAHGVAFAFAILVESPVIMLMSAATALVRDGSSYRRMRRFANALNLGTTLALLGLLIPSVYDWVMITAIGLPEDVAQLTYGALWLFLPWPAAIGVRRFLQGVLIRSGRTRLVAYGTVLRLLAMAGVALLLATLTRLPGAWVGAASLSAGVVVEAVASRWMAGPTIRRLVDGGDRSGTPELTYRRILRFYYPLALTSLIGLAAHPMLTFFMGRSAAPVESLAVFPVVHALSFIFRALGLSYQDASIALIGDRQEHLPELARFAAGLGLAASVGLGLIAFTPLADVWFSGVAGLTTELSALALTPTRILVALPAMSVLLSLQRAILMTGNNTRPITTASVIEIGLIALLFVLFGWKLGMVGVTAAFLSFVLSRVAAVSYLSPICAATHRKARSRATSF